MDFWHTFIVLAVFIPLTILWVTCIVDLIFRRHDMSGGKRAAWIVVIIVFPALGAIGYIAFGGLSPQHIESSAMVSSPRDEALRTTGRAP
jgi:Phospholipase_D-nuclease N-terminal